MTYCYLLLQSLVNSPDRRERLPDYLAELKKMSRVEKDTINSSSANLGAIINILSMVSSIPADADAFIIEVRFYFKSYLYLLSPLAPFVIENDILPEENPQLVRVRSRKVVRE